MYDENGWPSESTVMDWAEANDHQGDDQDQGDSDDPEPDPDEFRILVASTSRYRLKPADDGEVAVWCVECTARQGGAAIGIARSLFDALGAVEHHEIATTH